jgi:hypothetical protein
MLYFGEPCWFLRCRFERRCELFEARFERVETVKRTVKRIDFREE